MTYIIKCCNCYFDLYLLEINRRPKIMDLERSNLLNIIRIKDMRTELKSKDGIQKQLFLIDGEIVFHPCFDCVYKALQISSYRNNALILAMPEKNCLGVTFISRSCLEETNYELNRSLYISPSSFCSTCQERLVFYVINKYFKSTDKSFIVNC